MGLMVREVGRYAGEAKVFRAEDRPDGIRG